MATPDLTPFLPSLARISPHSRIYKDECAYCFHAPEDEGGLYVCLKTLVGLCPAHLPLHIAKTDSPLYLLLRRSFHRTAPPPDSDPKPKPTVLGIGVPGGFEADGAGVEVRTEAALWVEPLKLALPFPSPALPGPLVDVAQAVLEADSAARKEDLGQWQAQLQESVHGVDLQQEDSGVQVGPEGWTCAQCDARENLWLCLTCGNIGCGRRNFDGSGGNGHGLAHYEATGHPLSVKLGTITAEGADVFSYPEDDMVLDRFLAQHLAHFGIDVHAMRKTERSMAELELDANLNLEFSLIEERGHRLEPLYGPGLTGMRNLGNTCYMASVLQVLFSTPAFQRRYVLPAETLLRSLPGNPAENLTLQLARLGQGLSSGLYSCPAKERLADAGQEQHMDEGEAEGEGEGKGGRGVVDQEGVSPRMLKAVVGRGHPEFSTNAQQDALEFLQHLLELIARTEKTLRSEEDPTQALRFTVEERIECAESGRVQYVRRTDNVLPIHIPPTAAAADPAHPPRIPLLSCLHALGAPETVDGVFSAALGRPAAALKSLGLASFPAVLVLQARRFTFQGWVPRKMDVLLEVEDRLDLAFLRSAGPRPGETLQPSPGQPSPDPAILAAIQDMGFSREAAVRAALGVGNESVEAAVNWVFAHMEDADLNSPLPAAAPPSTAAADVSPEAVEMLTGMGFTESKVRRALAETDGNVERAVDWLFSRADGEEEEAAAVQAEGGEDVGSTLYELFAVVSHIGPNVHCGHYVAHIKKGDVWVQFNDRKVARSVSVPKELGYLYFYRRIDTQ